MERALLDAQKMNEYMTKAAHAQKAAAQKERLQHLEQLHRLNFLAASLTDAAAEHPVAPDWLSAGSDNTSLRDLIGAHRRCSPPQPLLPPAAAAALSAASACCARCRTPAALATLHGSVHFAPAMIEQRPSAVAVADNEVSDLEHNISVAATHMAKTKGRLEEAQADLVLARGERSGPGGGCSNSWAAQTACHPLFTLPARRVRLQRTEGSRARPSPAGLRRL